jgi:ribosomal protein S18 acetylase RimI-like enzyme
VPSFPAVTVRLAEPGEYLAVGALTEAAYRARGLLHEEYAAQLRDAERRAREAELLVAVDADGTLLATATLCPPGSPWTEVAGPDEAELRMLAVAPDAQNRGLGQLLSEACVARARELGCRALVLCTPSTLTVAQRLYDRLGFVRVPDRDWSPASGILLLSYSLAL